MADKVKSFLEAWTAGEFTLLTLLSGVAIVVMGIQFGKLLAVFI